MVYPLLSDSLFQHGELTFPFLQNLPDITRFEPVEISSADVSAG